MDQPLVSIIIPVYNGENYLKEAIESALSQTYKNIEILVINDGSKDSGATEKIALSYGDKIRYFDKENGGVATALNLGIENMRGEYFSWLSHDDLYYPEKVEVQINHLKKTGEMKAIIYSNYEILEMKSHVYTKFKLEKIYTPERVKNPMFAVLQGLVYGCTLLIHKSHFDRVGLFNTNMITTQDYDLWFRMFRNQKIEFVPMSLVVCREHNERGSKTIACYNKEKCDLRLEYVNSLTDQEVYSAYRTRYNFYHNVALFFLGHKMESYYKIVNSKFQEENMPNDVPDKIRKLRNLIDNFSDGKAKRICIFCAGDFGIRMYYDLKDRLIPVEYFSDNDEKKWGYFLDEKKCISPKELLKIKNDTLIIVSALSFGPIVEQLRTMGFPFVITKYDIESEILDTPPIKWIQALNNIEELDYSSKPVLELIDTFNKAIFDICRYYEDRITKHKE